MTYKSEYLQTLSRRGYIHQMTDAEGIDAKAAVPGALMAYIGFDLTGPSLHIGHLMSIMMLRRLQQHGGRPIALMGGGTTKVGDPSGKDTQRQMLDQAAIDANKASIKRVFERFLDFDGPNAAIMVDNADWLEQLNYIEFLRDYGRHFSVNRMLTMDSVRLRLEREQPLSFLEFNYMVLQSYDFVELNRRMGCVMQMGGSDQWGNIIMGVDLTRKVSGKEVYGLTTPLITNADGSKMGKTAGGAVWLNSDMLSDWDYWQYWRNVDDRDVGRFLRLFTDMPEDEIVRLESLQGAEINDAKVALANAATALCRGEDAAAASEATAKATFAEGGAGESLPRIQVSYPIALVDALVAAGLASSKGEARRKIGENAVRINGEQVSDAAFEVTEPVKLSMGKKRHALLVD